GRPANSRAGGLQPRPNPSLTAPSPLGSQPAPSAPGLQGRLGGPASDLLGEEHPQHLGGGPSAGSRPWRRPLGRLAQVKGRRMRRQRGDERVGQRGVGPEISSPDPPCSHERLSEAGEVVPEIDVIAGAAYLVLVTNLVTNTSTQAARTRPHPDVRPHGPRSTSTGRHSLDRPS